MDNLKPWVSFCMSTYKRPNFLKTQIEVLLKQTFVNFEIVISDNDPLASGKPIVDLFNDVRISYESNSEDLGMIKSYNKSIDRAKGEFVVMVTDDDPVFDNMLEFFHALHKQYPNFSVYCGIKRTTAPENVEIIDRNNFLSEILDNRLSKELHWSSFLLKRKTLIEIGKLADYGSGHLVDHVLISLMGSYDGSVIVNQKFSSIQLHDSNYSKINFENYYLSSIGFYNTLIKFFIHLPNYKQNEKVILKHLHQWFITSFFNLRRFYTFNYPDKLIIKNLDKYAQKIMMLPHMKICKRKYNVKKIVFQLKCFLPQSHN